MTPPLHICTHTPHIKMTTKEYLIQNFDTKFYGRISFNCSVQNTKILWNWN